MRMEKNIDCDRSVILTTRVRYARNIEDYPFDLSSSQAMRSELLEKVRIALGNKFLANDMSSLDANARLALCEGHKISPIFMNQAIGTLFSDEERGIYIMVPEEDHIRLQVIGDGYCPETVMERANTVLADLSDKLRFSFNSRLGYLTRCPTNLGYGLRLSVMAFLPGLTTVGDIARLSDSLGGLGFNLRGMYGEGTSSEGFLYQISNRYSLGSTENEILLRFVETIGRVIEAELKARAHIDRDLILDTAGRAYGIMAYAGRISYDEFLKHYASLRLGYALQLSLPESCNIHTLDALLTYLAPGQITCRYHCKNAEDRDRARADRLRREMKGELNE
ncbi:MAG: hypothetical protein E7616_03200 [Ruminococcaceae bacterium]|nr:hypothetical protein [Oscillospiraceae bacterium]